MFSKFNLKGFTKDNGIFDEYDYLTRGEELYNINKRKIESWIEKQTLFLKLME